MEPESPLLPAALVETHLSVVTFVGDHAYKLKKPVRFPFVDLSSRSAREALCHREVELNRRLAPDVYEGVADVIGPDGSPCDHLVVMRRMAADRRLSRLVGERDSAVPRALDELAVVLADFHRRAERSPAIEAAGAVERIRALWRGNAAEMRRFDGTTFPACLVDATLARAEAYLDGRGPLFAARQAAGRICDGHGDLQADDVFVLPDGPRVLDCIEFDDDLRYGDVAADVAFLAMDLERLGAPDLATRFVGAYEEAAGERLPQSLLHLYIAYRAQVRAKVTALRVDQEEAAGADPVADRVLARQLLELCDDHLRDAAVRLVLVGGLPGTGKTTVARALAERFGWPVLRSDVIRKRRAGLVETVPASAGFREGLYGPGPTDATYRELAEEAGRLLALGETVVLDASFTSDDQRRRLRRVAATEFANLIELRCTLPAAEAARRMVSRRAAGGDASDADADIAARLAAEADPWPQAVEVPTRDRPGMVADHVVDLVARLR